MTYGRKVPRTLFVVLGVVVAGFTASVALAVTWAESGDAGDLPATAQTPVGSGALTTITGRITADSDADMFKICLTGGGTFSASTVGTLGTLSDTQLFLFDSGGLGVEGNDDAAAGVSRSSLTAGGLSPAAPGVYYLAISGYNTDPVSLGGLIFPDGAPFDAIHGPVGPGGGQPIIGWPPDFVPYFGTYTIDLTGALYCGAMASTQILRDEMVAYRATVTDTQDGRRLDDAIKHLDKSLEPAFWVDATHVNSHKVFDEEKKAVDKLVDIQKDRNSTVPDATSQAFIDRIVAIGRELAVTAIADAAGGDANELAKANEELAKGDQDAAAGKPASAIAHYKHAWEHAQKA